jgi:hypothetical protein
MGHLFCLLWREGLVIPLKNTSPPTTHRHLTIDYVDTMTLFTTIATLLLSVLTALTTTRMIEAFVSSPSASQLLLPESSSSPGRRRHSTLLHSTSLDKDRIKKAGAGITTKAPGNNCIYDPNVDAKLQGTDNLNDRITSGAAYPPSSSKNASAAGMITTSTTPYNQRNEQVMASANAGKSRWGSFEVERVAKTDMPSSSSSTPTTESSSANNVPGNKLNTFTTNLTKLLNGEQDNRFKKRSQY